jgi:hypothetical protein
MQTKQADEGVGCRHCSQRPGSLPHFECRCAISGKLSDIAHSCVPRAAPQPAAFFSSRPAYERRYDRVLVQSAGRTTVENLTYNYPAGTNNGKIGSMYNAVSGETVTYTYD